MTVPARSNLTSGGRFARPSEKKPGMDVASAARTTTFTSPVFNIEDAIEIDAELNVSASSGTTPTLQLKLQVSQDGTTFVDAWPNTLPNVTGNGVQRASFLAAGTVGRWVATIGGTTPSFTFSIDTQAIVSQ